MTSLFPDNFLAAIYQLKLHLRLAPPRTVAGAYISRAAGASLQFRDYQSYAPGDDLRRVDWNVYARTRHLFVRRFDRPTAVPVFLLVDTSRSMLMEETPGDATRYATAARAAAAITSAAVASQNPVYLTTADSAALPRVLTGRRGLVRALGELAIPNQGGTLGISRAITALAPLLASRGPGVLVVISDFFDDAGVQAISDALRLMPGRVVLVQVTQPGDEDPTLTQDYELADCESNAILHVSPDADRLEQYRQAYAAYFDELNRYATARGALYVKINAASDMLSQLQQLFPGGTLAL